MPYLDMTNEKHGRLTVLEKSHRENGNTYWKCICDCGNVVIKNGRLIRDGRTLSCGCIKKEILTKRNTTHGMSKSKINMVWQEMRSRCLNKNHKRYADYGGRGINVCEEWSDFKKFYDDMHESYKEGLTLDRIDNSKEYSKENCRWATIKQQNNNKRNNVYETVDGITATRSELADLFGVPRCTFYWRINHGMTVEQALKKPTKKLNKV